VRVEVEITDGSIDAGLHLLAMMPVDLVERLSLAEIAEVCGCTRGNIWHIEQAALRKVRREFERRGLTEEMLR
jgi:DNA-directed RNA polymerase sigma subunit (sigma70/sigma32)